MSKSTSPTVTRDGNRITVHGDLTLHTARRAFALMPPVVDEIADEHITVDLTGILDADSAALALLVHWKSRARVQIKFTGASPQLQQLAKITNLSDLF